jgi:hypothetical protein
MGGAGVCRRWWGEGVCCNRFWAVAGWGESGRPCWGHRGWREAGADAGCVFAGCCGLGVGFNRFAGFAAGGLASTSDIAADTSWLGMAPWPRQGGTHAGYRRTCDVVAYGPRLSELCVGHWKFLRQCGSPPTLLMCVWLGSPRKCVGGAKRRLVALRWVVGGRPFGEGSVWRRAAADRRS